MHTLQLTENDYLALFLYEASTDPYTKGVRTKSILRTALLFVIFAVCFYETNHLVAYFLIGCSAAYFIFGKLLTRKKYIAHYKQFINSKYKAMLHYPVQIEIADLYVKTISHVGDANYKVSAIWRVEEIASHYFLKLSSNQNILIPKTDSTLNQEIQDLIIRHHIDHIINLDWKWN
jgi:hypothetical protein